MGTFHNKGELHGITVVVDTPGPRVYVGRCWELSDEQIVLLDVGEHEEGAGGRSKEDFVREAARVGVWKTHDRLVLSRSAVSSVRRLGEIPLD